ncbi:MAG: adenylate/guanylate cyclase domain-containing protein [Deltaproteobacteria bacterium]|nr:adenylate/guanylate cyclase domain-containing protein [Deltaproteobacteria bacterium]
MHRLKQLLKPTGYKIGILITILSLIIYGIGIPFFHMIELKAFDFHFLSRGKIKTGSDVVIVAIDEKSLDRFGRWPWPRTRIAELQVTSVIEKIEKDADNDLSLASALKDNSSVILGYFFFTSRDEIKHLKDTQGKKAESIMSSRYSSVRYIEKTSSQPDVLNALSVEENIPVIANAASDFGYFNIVPDSDGTVRWAPLALKYKDDFYPHISLEAVRKYLGSPPLILNVAQYGVDSINIGNKVNIPTDERGRLLINFRGPQKTFPHYSFSDVVDGLVPTDALKNKIVLVGATATGIYDMRVIPFAGTFPGIEIHANIIDNIIQGDFLHRPDWIVVFDILAILLLGAFLSIVIPKIRPVYTAMLTLTLIGFYMIANNYIFNNWNIWLTEIYPIFTILIVSSGVTTFQFMTEEREKRKIGKAFSHYVSPSLVNEIIKDPKKLVLGGEEKRLSVLFSDIRGFTTISEGLKPQVLVKLMNDYLTPMTDIVLNNGGTIDKYMGDAIMAFWGAPIWQEDHQIRACRTALEMLKKLSELQTIWEKQGIPKLDIGVGISTGKVTVGNMGSSTRFDYTVIGDTVNLGSRLEGLNKEYGTHIILPKYTYADVKEEFILRELDMVRVKGKEIPIKIYELMGEMTDSDNLKKAADMFETGLKLYREKKWEEAEGYFYDVMRFKPDDAPSKVFLSRIETLREQDLPSDWDGVFVMTKK